MRSRNVLLALVFLGWCGDSALRNCIARRWEYETVLERPRSFSVDCPVSMVVDSSDTAHIFYGDRCVYHAWHSGLSWRHEVIHTGGVVRNSISGACDGAGHLHVCFIGEGDSRELYYAHNTEGGWSVETVDCGGVGEYYEGRTALGVAANGAASICFVNVEGGVPGEEVYDLIYLSHNSGVWEKQTVASSGAGYIRGQDLVLDETGGPHVSFVRFGIEKPVVLYGSKTGGVWSIEHVCSQIAGSTAVDMDSSNQVHICIDSRAYYGCPMRVLYVRRSAGRWEEPEVVDSDTGDERCFGNVAVGDDGHVHLTYLNTRRHVIRYAHGGPGCWQVEDVGPYCEEGQTYPTSVLDSGGTLHLAYQSRGRIIHGVREGSGWNFGRADVSTRLSAASAVTTDSEGHVHIIQHNLDPQHGLLYSSNKYGQWFTQNTGVVGSITSNRAIAVDPGGVVHVCYMYNDQLGYLTDGSGQWEGQIVCSEGGKEASLVADAAGRVYIVHLSREFQEHIMPALEVNDYTAKLKFSCRFPNPCLWSTLTLKTVEPSCSIGLHSCLTLDSLDRVNVAYSLSRCVCYLYSPRSYESEIVLFRNGPGNWAKEIVYESTEDERFSDCVVSLDSSDCAHLLCYEKLTSTLTHWTNTSGAWVGENPFSAPMPVSSPLGLACDGKDVLHVSYIGGTADALRMLSGGTSLWNVFTVDLCSGGECYPSLAVDPCDSIHISYYDAASEARQHASNTKEVALAEVLPEALDFAAYVGTTISKSVTVRSVGDKAVNVSSCNLGGADAGEFSLTEKLPVVLPPGSSTEIEVFFHPSKMDIFDCFLRINCSCEDHPKVFLDIHGRGLSAGGSFLEILAPKGWEGFGEVIVGKSSPEAVFRIRNKSLKQTIKLAGISLLETTDFSMDPGGSEGCGWLFPRSLSPGGECKVRVSFSPTTIGGCASLLCASSISPVIENASISLEGTGVAAPEPEIFVSPSECDFGEVHIGQSSVPIPVSVLNVGDCELKVLEVALASGKHFTLDLKGGKKPFGPELPVTIGAGELRTFAVGFEAFATGTFEDEVVISSYDPGNPKVCLQLTGRGYRWNVCDLDLNGVVDFGDFAILAGQWLSPPGLPSADVAEPRDHVVDARDLRTCVEYWLTRLE